MNLNIWGSSDSQDNGSSEPKTTPGQPSSKQALNQFLQNSAAQPAKAIKKSAPQPKK